MATKSDSIKPTPAKRPKRVRYAKEEYAPEVYTAVYEALADPRRYTFKQVKEAIRARERGEPFPF